MKARDDNRECRTVYPAAPNDDEHMSNRAVMRVDNLSRSHRLHEAHAHHPKVIRAPSRTVDSVARSN